MNKIFLPIREILYIRKLFREEKDLDIIKWRLRLEIERQFTNSDVSEKYFNDLDEIFQKVMNMSLEDIIYGASAEIFNKNMVVGIEYK